MSKESKNTFINKVNAYYDNNSALFLKLGVDKSHFNIHQPLWATSVKSQPEAASYSNLQIAKLIETFLNNISEKHTKKHPKIVDLGCGVGGSLLFLQQYFQSEDYQFSGLTLSQKQVDIGRQIIQEANANIHIQQGNFQEVGKYFKEVDVIYMIEAFVHSPDYETLIEQASQCLTKGGLFIVLDDWLNISPIHQQETKWINQYTSNWLIGSLIATNQLEQTCNRHHLKLQQSHNFTPFIKTGLRNKLLRMINLPLSLFPFQSTYINSLLGGIARHYCLKLNWINYQMMVFRKG